MRLLIVAGLQKKLTPALNSLRTETTKYCAGCNRDTRKKLRAVSYTGGSEPKPPESRFLLKHQTLDVSVHWLRSSILNLLYIAIACSLKFYLPLTIDSVVCLDVPLSILHRCHDSQDQTTCTSHLASYWYDRRIVQIFLHRTLAALPCLCRKSERYGGRKQPMYRRSTGPQAVGIVNLLL